MSWRSYLFPRILERFSTPYNKDVRVIEEHGKYKLLVYGSRQSGEYIKMLWIRALSHFGVIPSPACAGRPDMKHILVLGVAGGTVIHMLRATYPDAAITGIDIDEKMIEVGKKYFSLSSVTGLTLKVADAQEFVRRAVDDKKEWNIVVVDLYVGASIPPFVGEEIFLEDVKKLLAPRGILLVNYLREFEYEKLSDLLLLRLQKLFSVVKDTSVYCNRFFYCRI